MSKKPITPDTTLANTHSNSDILASSLIRLAELALMNDEVKVKSFLQRTARTLKNDHSDIAQRIQKLLSDRPLKYYPIASHPEPTPTGLDNDLPLIDVEFPDIHVLTPILDGNIERMLTQVVEEYQHVDKLLNVGLTPSTAILFTGPPGVGETLAATWLAAQLKIPLLVLNLASVINNWLGKTGVKLTESFQLRKTRTMHLIPRRNRHYSEKKRGRE